MKAGDRLVTLSHTVMPAKLSSAADAKRWTDSYDGNDDEIEQLSLNLAPCPASPKNVIVVIMVGAEKICCILCTIDECKYIMEWS